MEELFLFALSYITENEEESNENIENNNEKLENNLEEEKSEEKYIVDKIINQYKKGNDCNLITFYLSIDYVCSNSFCSTFGEHEFIKIDNDGIHNTNQYIAWLVQYNVFKNKEYLSTDSGIGYFPCFKLDNNNIEVYSNNDDIIHDNGHAQNTIFVGTNSKEVFDCIPIKYCRESKEKEITSDTEEDEDSEISEGDYEELKNDIKYKEYHDYILNCEFLTDETSKKEFMDYFVLSKLEFNDLIKYYEKINNKIVVTYSAVNHGNAVPHDYYYEFDKNNEISILNKIIEKIGEFKHAPEEIENKDILLIQLKENYLRNVWYNRKTKELCCDQLGHCVCGDFSDYIRFSDNTIAEKYYNLLPKHIRCN